MQAPSRYEVTPERLRRVCKNDLRIADLRIPTRSIALDAPIELVGQSRVGKALDLALSLEDDFHVAVVVRDVSPEAIRDYVENKVRERQATGSTPALEDYCYIYNFKTPQSPVLLTFAPGGGRILKSAVKNIKDRLKTEIPVVLSEETVQKAKDDIEQEARQQLKEAVEEIYKKKVQAGWLAKWRKLGWTFALTDSIIEFNMLAPFGGIFRREDLKKLPPHVRDFYSKGWNEVVEKGLREINRLINEVAARILDEVDKKALGLETEIYDARVDLIFDAPLKYYSGSPKIRIFLEGLKQHVKENQNLFIPSSDSQMMGPMGPMEMPPALKKLMGGKDEDHFLPFEVNLLVDNKDTANLPILISSFSTYSELFGKIEREFAFSGVAAETRSNLTMIKPGLFHQANGGFVILSLNDTLMNKQSVFLGLNRVLKEKVLRIRDYSDEYGVSFGGKMLTPEPVPLRLKVIVLVSPEFYYTLWRFPYYREFIEIFKVKAEFDRDVEYAFANLDSYTRYINRYSREQGFLFFDAEAKAKVFEFLLRENSSQERFIWDLEKLRTVLREANFYAEGEKEKEVRARHVQKAIEEKVYRSNLIQERIRKYVNDGLIFIDTAGEKIGQINGLVVYMLGDFGFGGPSRITVTTFKGTRGLINIEKEANLSGKTLTKSIEIVKGFFQERFGQNRQLNFEGRICFEQAYHGVEGDSASAAELIALISSLARVPIKQNLAITGSINQKGQIQPIGGVNEKVEGFFGVCKERGFALGQGVVIPAANIRDLMLNEEVVEAVREGKFRVFAISDVDQGLEILTGRPAKEINRLVHTRLKKWSKKNKGLFGIF